MCLTIVRKLLRTWGKCSIDCLFDLCVIYLIMEMNTCNFLCSEHYQKISGEGSLDIENRHEAEFEHWFQNRICGCNAGNVLKQLYDLACGPSHQVRSYRSCIVNGVKFHIKEREQTLYYPKQWFCCSR
jgi:hypothetical protein